jgi:HTH-type transcriptional regulator / antitoxin HigA
MTTPNEVPAGHCFCVRAGDAVSALAVWPLRTEEDYRKAVAKVDSLVTKGEESLTVTECAQLEIFTTLIEAYENTYHPIDVRELTPVELLKKLMDESGMTQSDLGRMLGDRSLGYRILSGQRKLSKKHVKLLSDYFKIDPGVFLS